MFFTAIAITVVSNVLYHVFQKLTPGEAHPILSLLLTYVAAFIFCLALFPFFPLTKPLGESVRQLNWTSVALGLAILGLEIGFLLAYRAGWELSMASLVSNTTVSLLLVGVGLSFFREKISFWNGAGVLLCLLGLVMVNWKQ